MRFGFLLSTLLLTTFLAGSAQAQDGKTCYKGIPCEDVVQAQVTSELVQYCPQSFALNPKTAARYKALLEAIRDRPLAKMMPAGVLDHEALQRDGKCERLADRIFQTDRFKFMVRAPKR